MVGQGKLIPPEEESYNHGARTCRVGKDGMLCVTADQAHNVLPRDKLKLYDEVGIGGIVLMNAFVGSKREVFTCGIRNSVGMAFYTGKKFPGKYQGGFVLAQHDSWNRTSPIGARSMFTNLKAEALATRQRCLLKAGWMLKPANTTAVRSMWLIGLMFRFWCLATLQVRFTASATQVRKTNVPRLALVTSGVFLPGKCLVQNLPFAFTFF